MGNAESKKTIANTGYQETREESQKYKEDMTIDTPVDDNDTLDDMPHFLSGLPGENVIQNVQRNESKLRMDMQSCNTSTIRQYPETMPQCPKVPKYTNTVPQFTNENSLIQEHGSRVHDNNHAFVSKRINATEYNGRRKQKNLQRTTYLDNSKCYPVHNNACSRFKTAMVYEEGSNCKCCAEARYRSRRCWCNADTVSDGGCTGDEDLSDSDKICNARLMREKNRINAVITDKGYDSMPNNCNKSSNDFPKQEQNVAFKSGQWEMNQFPHSHSHNTEHTFHNECKGASKKSYGHRCLYVPLKHLPKLNDSSSDEATEGKTRQFNIHGKDRHNENCRYSNNCRHFERYRSSSDEQNHVNDPCDKQIRASDDDSMQDEQTQFQTNDLVFVEDHFGLLTGSIASGISKDFRLPQSENVEIPETNIKHGQQIRVLEINGISKISGLENMHKTNAEHPVMRGVHASDEITGLRKTASNSRYSNSTLITNPAAEYEARDVSVISAENENEDSVSIAFCDICKEETGLCVCIFIE